MPLDTVIIEDEEAISMVIQVVLSHRGISVREAHTGEEGLNIINREHPAVVLLDVRLPDMEGWDVCRKLKQNGDGNAPAPAVVFLTAATQERDRQKAQEVGGDFFIPKPFDIDQLVDIVRDFLKR
ncbi:MAG: response regulator transcription factor [Chitinivibrionales bacterium]